MEAKNGDQFIIDDFLNYSTEDDEEMVAVSSPTTPAVSTVSGSSSTSAKSSSSSFSSSNRLSKLSQIHYGKEIIAGRNFQSSFEDSPIFTSEYDRQLEFELEWVSNFYEDKFSAEDLEKQQLISGKKKTSHSNKLSPEKGSNTATTAMFSQENRVTGKPRSKRSRSVPRNWTSRLPPAVLPSPSTTNITAAEATTTSNMSASCLSSSSSYEYSDITTNSTGKKTKMAAAATLLKEEKEFWESVDATINGGGRESRKCFHCATDKTPQWRTGPMGPKTLCNACGVRFKSGRLVPEYRPASSPTFVLTKHSNSHRKVLELRKQKEEEEEDIVRTHQNLQQWRRQQQQFLVQNKIVMFDLCNNGDIEMDFGRLKTEFI